MFEYVLQSEKCYNFMIYDFMFVCIAKLSLSQPANPQLGAERALLLV